MNESDGGIISDPLEKNLSEKDSIKNAQDVLQHLYMNSNMSDVNVKSYGNKTFPCHKNILAARSNVFKKMFENKDFKENLMGEVMIEIDPEPLTQFIKFIYTDVLELTALNQEQLIQLLAASHMYNIGLLKSRCEDYMSNNVSTDNVLSSIRLV